MSITRPPSDIAPQTFFEEWLPGEYRKLVDATDSKPAPPDTTVVFKLAGEGGGDWTITVKDGELDGAAGAAETADFIFALSTVDWRAIIVGEDGAPQLIPGDANPMDALLAADASVQQALAAVSGTVIFNVTEFNGRTFVLKLSFKGAAEPEATITVDTDTLAQMRSGAMAPPQAYFAGKIQLGGDVTFAMQLGMAMMARTKP